MPIFLILTEEVYTRELTSKKLFSYKKLKHIHFYMGKTIII